MTISITLPEAFTAFKNEALKNDGGKNEQCWHVIGEPLNTRIQDKVPDFYEKLELGDRFIAMTKRGEILDLFWGRIEQDAAALKGLQKALENLSATITANVTAVSEQWSGESYDAFATAMGKIKTTLDAYAVAAGKVSDILAEAMTQARAMYEEFATYTLQELEFKGISPAGHWHKMDQRKALELAMSCACGAGFLCKKHHSEAVAKIKDRFATTRLLAASGHDPCWDNLEHVLNMYEKLVRHGEEGRQSIRDRVEEWCGNADKLKENIRDLLTVAVGNLYTLGRSSTFASLHLTGGGGGQPSGGDPGSPPGGDPGYPSGGDPSGGDPGGGDPSGGAPGGGAPSAEPIVDPTATVEPPPPAEQPEAVAQPEAPAQDPGTVTVSDGERTIGVSNPGVEGHVTITVTGADGVTKTYDLDFDAASGLGPRASDEQPVASGGAEQVAARSDGKCVIQDGDITITAERPLFAPDQITLTLDDGAGNVSKYTVDFPDVPESPTDTADPPTNGRPEQSDVDGDPVQQVPAQRPDANGQPAAEPRQASEVPEPDAKSTDEPTATNRLSPAEGRQAEPGAAQGANAPSVDAARQTDGPANDTDQAAEESGQLLDGAGRPASGVGEANQAADEPELPAAGADSTADETRLVVEESGRSVGGAGQPASGVGEADEAVDAPERAVDGAGQPVSGAREAAEESEQPADGADLRSGEARPAVEDPERSESEAGEANQVVDGPERPADGASDAGEANEVADEPEQPVVGADSTTGEADQAGEDSELLVGLLADEEPQPADAAAEATDPAVGERVAGQSVEAGVEDAATDPPAGEAQVAEALAGPADAAPESAVVAEQAPGEAPPVAEGPAVEEPESTGQSVGMAGEAEQVAEAPELPAAGQSESAGVIEQSADDAVPVAREEQAAGAATVPQAWAEDARGSVSGVLEPESDGEAGLAVAPDSAVPQEADAAGMAGAGMPMAGSGPGGTQDNGRAGSGWSVHGDLFDAGEPVYSMHGVLGDEDAERSDG